jgi:hypothetical protein
VNIKACTTSKVSNQLFLIFRFDHFNIFVLYILSKLSFEDKVTIQDKSAEYNDTIDNGKLINFQLNRADQSYTYDYKKVSHIFHGDAFRPVPQHGEYRKQAECRTHRDFHLVQHKSEHEDYYVKNKIGKEIILLLVVRIINERDQDNDRQKVDQETVNKFLAQPDLFFTFLLFTFFVLRIIIVVIDLYQIIRCILGIGNVRTGAREEKNQDKKNSFNS